MTKKHIWYIKDKYFFQYQRGAKDIEVRVGYDNIKRAKQGDILTFTHHENVEFQIIRVAVYPTFEAMLKQENFQRILPGASANQTLKTLRKIYPKAKENLGVYVFELKLASRQPTTKEYFKVSFSRNSMRLVPFLIKLKYLGCKFIS